MLQARIATAVVLLAVLLPAIFWAPSWVWGLISLLAVTVAAREWERLLGHPLRPLGLASVVAVLGAGWLVLRESALGGALHELAWVLALGGSVFWLFLAPLSLQRVQRVGGGRVVAAWLLLSAWVALFELRRLGPWSLVSSMALVWCADIGAYAVGRMVGRHKLAPRVSPGKTWEGALGGWAMAWLGVTVLGAWGAGLAGAMAQRSTGFFAVAVIVTLLVALSIVGDLYESLLKRLAGVKDSGSILPGHGGVLDRIDALLPSMPVCWLLLDYLGT